MLKYPIDKEFIITIDLETTVNGKPWNAFDEVSGATPIERLRSLLGGQIVSTLLIETISEKGCSLAVSKNVIEIV